MDSLLGSPSEELRKYQRLELPKSHRWFPHCWGLLWSGRIPTRGQAGNRKSALAFSWPITRSRSQWLAKVTRVKSNQVYKHLRLLDRPCLRHRIVGNPHTDAQQLSQGFWSLQEDSEQALCSGNVQQGATPGALLNQKAQQGKGPISPCHSLPTEASWPSALWLAQALLRCPRILWPTEQVAASFSADVSFLCGTTKISLHNCCYIYIYNAIYHMYSSASSDSSMAPGMARC